MANYEIETVKIGNHDFTVTAYDTNPGFVSLSCGMAGEHGFPELSISMDLATAARLGNALIEASVKYRVEPAEPLADPELPF